ncbi:MAG: alpha/beta hydrolase, partial [Acidimicrobiia bacterium]|nr:alpha/beta hydrolase [Acidimicrobiia bacterium]
RDTTGAGPATTNRQQSTGRSEPGPERQPAPPPEVVWDPCGDGFDCGAVEVPIDYDRPEAGHLSISMIRRPAPGPARGSIFVNPGGPGASGVDFVRSGFQLDPATSAEFHVIGFDPRGIGRSDPLSCSLDRTSQPFPDLSPDSAIEQATLDEEARALIERCLDTDGELIPHLTTLNVARDLDRLRQAVGDEGLNYLGLSYGTLLGLYYGRLFPDTTARLVLDGVVDPELSLTELLAQQAEAFEQGFSQLAKRCRTDDSCPSGGLQETFDRVLERLERSGPIDGAGATELVLASLLPIYNPTIFDQYRDALIAADNGSMAGIDRLSDFLVGSISFTAYAAFACADGAQPVGARAWTSFAARLEREAPRFGAVIANELRVCSMWPRPDLDPGALAVGSGATSAGSTGAPPAAAPLIIGNTGDAATPLENAERVAAELTTSHLVVVDGLRHTAYTGSRCVQALVADYFADKLQPGRSNCSLD